MIRAIGLSLLAIRLAQRPAKGALTYGLKRTEILSAQFNGATLLVLALMITYEGIRRLVSPPDSSSNTPRCRSTTKDGELLEIESPNSSAPSSRGDQGPRTAAPA